MVGTVHNLYIFTSGLVCCLPCLSHHRTIFYILEATQAPRVNMGHHTYKTEGYPAAARNMAGPGQRPPMPHPTPNKPAPAKSRLSMVVLVGTEKWFVLASSFFSLDDRGRDNCRESWTNKLYPGTNSYDKLLTNSPPPMTNRRVGSQAPRPNPLRSRKPIICLF